MGIAKGMSSGFEWFIHSHSFCVKTLLVLGDVQTLLNCSYQLQEQRTENTSQIGKLLKDFSFALSI